MRMTASPGVTPFALSFATSRRRSTYTFSAIARPSIRFAIGEAGIQTRITPIVTTWSWIVLALALALVVILDPAVFDCGDDDEDLSYRISISAIIAFCNARRSASSSSDVPIDFIW